MNISPQRHGGHREGYDCFFVLALGVPPRIASRSLAITASGSRFPLYSSLVPRCGVPLKSLTRILLVLSICIAGCNRPMSFEKNGWQKKFNGDYPDRDAMVQDLLDNHTLVGLTTRLITEFLGEEDRVELVGKPKTDGRNYMTYQVLEEFGSDIDPVHTKYLVLEYNEDSIITKSKLLEWKK